jgi:hypothetical protein
MLLTNPSDPAVGRTFQIELVPFRHKDHVEDLRESSHSSVCRDGGWCHVASYVSADALRSSATSEDSREDRICEYTSILSGEWRGIRGLWLLRQSFANLGQYLI